MILIPRLAGRRASLPVELAFGLRKYFRRTDGPANVQKDQPPSQQCRRPRKADRQRLRPTTTRQRIRGPLSSETGKGWQRTGKGWQEPFVASVCGIKRGIGKVKRNVAPAPLFDSRAIVPPRRSTIGFANAGRGDQRSRLHGENLSQLFPRPCGPVRRR